MRASFDRMEISLDIAVSVIIPVYNVEKFLKETIESVLNQELQNFEIILINDGSTDSSAAICRKYAALDSRIYFFNQQNRGVSVARNEGLKYAKGKYVYFLDSDDTIATDFLSSSFRIADDCQADILVVGEYFTRLLPFPTALPTCGQIIKRSFLEEFSDIRFPEGIQPCEDGLLSHRLLALTNKLAANEKAVYFYRKHENQNHVKIHHNCWKVLRQIPQWFDLLDKFYSSYNLFSDKALHLARFIEHEPFYLRYTEMPLDDEQKKYLFNLIRSYFNLKVSCYLSDKEKKSLSKPFLFFLAAPDYKKFDEFYLKYKVLRTQKKRIYLLLSKLIPIPKVKKRVKHYLRNYY